MMLELEKHPELDVLATFFGPRAPFAAATAFVRLADRNSHPNPGVTCQRGDVVEVEATGLHFVVHRASLLRRLGPLPFGHPSDRTVTDDVFFCARVRALGGRVGVATGVPVFHVDERNGYAFLPGSAACAVAGDQITVAALPPPLPMEQRSFGARVDAAMRTLRPGEP